MLSRHRPRGVCSRTWILGNRGKRVVEVDSFFHELAFDDDTSFELVWLELRVIDWRPTMLDAEHPVSRSDFDSLGLVSPLFAKGPILDVAHFLAIHGSDPLIGTRGSHCLLSMARRVAVCI